MLRRTLLGWLMSDVEVLRKSWPKAHLANSRHKDSTRVHHLLSKRNETKRNGEKREQTRAHKIASDRLPKFSQRARASSFEGALDNWLESALLARNSRNQNCNQAAR